MRLEIYGDPAPQGSKRIIHGRLVEASSEKLKRWRKAIAAQCQATRLVTDKFYTDSVAVRVVFYLPRPKTVKRGFPIVPPDLDKLCRGLLDGIGQSQVIWGDDSQVIDLHATKVYADDREPGATVEIIEYNDLITVQ